MPLSFLLDAYQLNAEKYELSFMCFARQQWRRSSSFQLCVLKGPLHSLSFFCNGPLQHCQKIHWLCHRETFLITFTQVHERDRSRSTSAIYDVLWHTSFHLSPYAMPLKMNNKQTSVILPSLSTIIWSICGRKWTPWVTSKRVCKETKKGRTSL